MAYGTSERGGGARPRMAQTAKIVVAGGFGVGKTTLIGAISEVLPLSTEASMTSAARGVDDRSQVRGKQTTTVAMDFGRITIDDSLVLFLFGTPGQDRFTFMWDDIVLGALMVVLLVDTRRLADSYQALEYFETREIPFLVGVNRFDGAVQHDLDEVREALDLPDDVPIVAVDARQRASVKLVLTTCLEHLLTRGARHVIAR